MTDLLPVRVMVEDAWDEVPLAVPPATPLGDLKRRALALTHTPREPDAYLVKYRGAELADESASLAALGVVPNAPLIVMSRRRRPVR
jgi:hypothetical protein